MSARLIAALVLAGVSGTAMAQATAVLRQTLESADFPGHGLHTLLVRTTIDPGGAVPPHAHPGLEVAQVLSGAVMVTIGDAPPRLIGAGGSFQVAPGTRHAVRNASDTPAIVASTYVVDAASPLVIPRP